jgi:Flp pilus assembly protein TadG
MNDNIQIASGRRLRLGLRKLFRSEEGSNLVEMGLGMMTFMAVFFGVIQFSYAMYAYNWVSEASREATRWAIVRGSTCNKDLGSSFCDTNGASAAQITSFVKGLGYPGLSPNNMSVSTSWWSGSSTTPRNWTTQCTAAAPACNIPGNQVQVTVSYTFPLGIPFWKSTSLNLSSTSQMIIVQ